jgi:hypothetical protein
MVRLGREQIEQLEQMMAQFKSKGLDSTDLQHRLAACGFTRMQNIEVLRKMSIGIAEEVVLQESLERQIETELREVKYNLVQISGLTEGEASILPDTHVQHLRDSLAKFDQYVSAVKMLDAALDRQQPSANPIEFSLEQAVQQLARLVTALGTEQQSAAAVRLETGGIEALEKRKALHKTRHGRLLEAQLVIAELLEQQKSGYFSKQVMLTNAKSIAHIFASIHAPNEFVVHTDGADALLISREGTKQAVTLKEMSTGQRSAYALSLFLSMNRSLTSGPPVLLLDDPIAHTDDLNILSLLDHLRELAVMGERQIFIATANEKFAGLFRQKFRFMGERRFREISLIRS